MEVFGLSVSTQLVIVLRLLVATLAGAAIGWERHAERRPVGIRTLALVSLGAAAFTLVSIFGFVAGSGEVVDPARVAAQVATGVGFIGAGAIIRSRGEIRGVTTASGIWVAAALGMAAGVGMYIAAIAGTIIAVVVLLLFPRLRNSGGSS